MKYFILQQTQHKQENNLFLKILNIWEATCEMTMIKNNCEVY